MLEKALGLPSPVSTSANGEEKEVNTEETAGRERIKRRLSFHHGMSKHISHPLSIASTTTSATTEVKHEPKSAFMY